MAPQFQPRAINLAAVGSEAGSTRLSPRRHPHHHRPHSLRLGHRGSPASRPATLLHPIHPCLLPTPDPPQCSARRRAAPRRSRGSRRRGGSGGRWPRRWRRTSCTSTFSCLGGPSRRMRRWYVFIAMPGRRVFGGCLARLNGSGPGACGDGGMWRRDGTGGATGACWVWRLVSVVCDTAQVQTARRAQWGSLGHVVASGSAQPVREA